MTKSDTAGRPHGGFKDRGTALFVQRKIEFLRDVLTSPKLFERYILQHPERFAAGIGCCPPGVKYFPQIVKTIIRRKAMNDEYDASELESEQMTLEAAPGWCKALLEICKKIPWNVIGPVIVQCIEDCLKQKSMVLVAEPVEAAKPRPRKRRG